MTYNDAVRALEGAIHQWLDREGIAKSTLAGAIVVLDKLCSKVPLTDADVFTQSGQVRGARGQNLQLTLAKYDIPSTLLKDGVTTRSTDKFRRLAESIKYGKSLREFSDEQRIEAVKTLIIPVRAQIDLVLSRKRLAITCNRHNSPAAWITEILTAAHDRSGGRVEQHLVGAKLECRFRTRNVNRLPAFAADDQTLRLGDFVIGKTVYHVTANPTKELIQKCADNSDRGFQPVALVPRNVVEKARGLAAYVQLDQRLIIFALEDFIAQNLIEMADDGTQQYFDMLTRVVTVYNRRIEEAETDASLMIELH